MLSAAKKGTIEGKREKVWPVELYLNQSAEPRFSWSGYFTSGLIISAQRTEILPSF